MPHYTVANRTPKGLFPGILMRSFWGENMTLAWTTLEPNSVTTRHQHPHEQAVVVIMGDLTIVTDEESCLIHPGEFYLIPGDAAHQVRAGAQGAMILDIFSPVREDFMY